MYSPAVKLTHCSNLAIIGASITVLASAFDTCFQQSVRYTLRTVVDDTKVAAVVAATNWNGVIGNLAHFSTAGK